MRLHCDNDKKMKRRASKQLSTEYTPAKVKLSSASRAAFALPVTTAKSKVVGHERADTAERCSSTGRSTSVSLLERINSVSNGEPASSDKSVTASLFEDDAFALAGSLSAANPLDLLHSAAFRIPRRASNAEIVSVLAELLGVGGIGKGAATQVSIGKPVETRGAYEGHCAYVSLIRSSGASLAPKQELLAVADLRRMSVAHLCSRLLADPQDTLSLVVASAAAAGYVHSIGKGKGGTAKGGVTSPSLAFTQEQQLCLGYLRGQLARDGKASTASQYAGPLELGAVAECLGCPIIILVEDDNKEDVGGAWLPSPPAAGASSSSSAPSARAVVAVNTRRQHMYPVLLPGTSTVWSPDLLKGVADAALSSFTSTLAGLRSGSSSDGAGAGSSAVSPQPGLRSFAGALEELLQGK